MLVRQNYGNEAGREYAGIQQNESRLNNLNCTNK